MSPNVKKQSFFLQLGSQAGAWEPEEDGLFRQFEVI
jgi:hypothetical protein